MEFTFGIITDGFSDIYIEQIIDSIRKNYIEKYEIIIVGNTKINKTNNIIIIYFDETIKNKWITRKKNIIIENAKYENIVLLHDYIIFDNNWYNGFIKFGNNFDICINKIINKNGKRFRDYTLFPLNIPNLPLIYHQRCLLPYDFYNIEKTNKYLYISGSYYVIKKHIANKYKLNEDLTWGEGEDYEFCLRIQKDNILIKCNQYSIVKFLKDKYQCEWENELTNDEARALYNL
jgi:hypothetical protein